jgi:uncharacterized protein
MKRIFLFFIFPLITATSFAQSDSLSKYDVPVPSGWINDYSNVFTPAEEKSLDSLVAAYEKETGVEIAILTTNEDLRDTTDLELFSLAVFNKWGVGKKEKNNGILFCIAIESRRIWIRNGAGIQTFLTDLETKRIIDRAIVPSFKNGEYYKGVREGIIAMQNRLKKNDMK